MTALPHKDVELVGLSPLELVGLKRQLERELTLARGVLAREDDVAVQIRSAPKNVGHDAFYEQHGQSRALVMHLDRQLARVAERLRVSPLQPGDGS